jgi:RNA-directed DNA polymerase
VLDSLRRHYTRLKLTINEAKSAVAPVRGRSFLGFTFWRQRGEVRRAASSKALTRLKDRLRTLTRRSRGWSIAQVVDDLRAYLPGWKAYFRLAQTPRIFSDLDEWLRHRLRTLHLKHWRRGRTIYRELCARGASPDHARLVAANSRSWWKNGAKALNRVLTLAYFDQLGLPRLS